RIDGLPVLQGERYLGVVTRYSIYVNYFLSNKQKEEYLTATIVKEIATHQEQYLVGTELFERTMLDLKDFPLLAVVDEDHNFQGVVTRKDVLESFESAF
ncbi:CBS domain-containing protein, partial [Alkalihalophilus pseudofirmus]